jgi:hypothetical protein
VWKPLAFLGIAVTAAGLGFTWHAIADPNRAQAAASKMSFAVFETDADVPLSVDGYLISGSYLKQNTDHFVLTVRAGSSVPNSVVIVSDRPVQLTPANGEVGLPRVQEGTSSKAQAELYYLLFHPSASANTITAEFSAPSTVRIDNQHGSVLATLPSISGHTGPIVPGSSSSDLDLLVGYHLEQGKVYEDFPHRSPDTAGVTSYILFDTPAQLSVPKNLSITERLAGGATGLNRGDIKQDLPATGGVKGPDFVWQSDSGLSPTLIAVSRAAEQDYASDEFRSGVAFAISAAALIALLQEGPARLRGRRRRLAGAVPAEGTEGDPAAPADSGTAEPDDDDTGPEPATDGPPPA